MPTYITKKCIVDFGISMKKHHRSRNTIVSYMANIQKLELYLDGRELTTEEMISYKKWLVQQGFKRRTINAYLAAANYFCDVMGLAEMKVSLEPIEADGNKQQKRQISSSNYKKLVYTALQNDKERLAMMIQVLCHMDIRFCELENLTVEALGLKMVEVVRKRHNKQIEIPEMISADLMSYAVHEKITAGIIFRTSNGLPIDRSNFRKDIKKLCVLAGVEEEFGSIHHIKHVVLDEYPYYRIRK